MDPEPRQSESTRAVTTPLPRDVRREVALLFGLFVSLRVMAVFWFRPLYSEAGEFFFPFAWLQDSGYYPFFDYWLEYPPVLAYLLVGLRSLSVWLCGTGDIAWQRLCFVRAVQLSSIVWETLSLALVCSLVHRLRGARAAARACWVYLALFSTAFVALSYVDTFPVFLMLVGLVLAFHGRPVWSAIAVAGGFMTKLIPIALLPTTLKSTGRWRWRLAAVGAFVLFAGYCGAPFLATGRHWLRLSFEASARRPPWETVWALLDGRHAFGYVGPGPRDAKPEFFERFRVTPGVRGALEGTPPELLGEPGVRRHIHYYRIASRFARDLSFIDSRPRKPWFWWIYGSVGVLLAVIYLGTFALLPRELPPRRRVTFAAFSLFVFFFIAKGWSPQFILYLIPLLLVAFAPVEGGLWSLLLTITVFAETPVWSHGLFGHPGKTALAQLVLQAAVLGRTLILLLVGSRLARRLFHD